MRGSDNIGQIHSNSFAQSEKNDKNPQFPLRGGEDSDMILRNVKGGDLMTMDIRLGRFGQGGAVLSHMAGQSLG